ncbi:MAG TPA: helix-turn-helix domain-containing protein [Mucilaginibacter sp.]|nr:helix-turn-helix domain-containing protein [Mucilaginibacter sp.]
MNYITQIKGFWLLHEKLCLNTTDTALYFYLLEVCNSAGWANPFRRNNAKIIADLKVSRSTLERARRRLSKGGILKFKSVRGTPNISYQLTDIGAAYLSRNIRADATPDAAADAGTDGLNKNIKPKQVVVVRCDQAFAFFVETKNNRMLKDRFGLDNNAVLGYFETFYHSKIDLGDLNGMSMEDIARNFYYWLPKHLAARQKEKSCAKKENTRQPDLPPQRGFAVAMQFANVKMREEK